MNEQQLKNLWNAIKDSFNVGTWDEFKSGMQTKEARKSFYDAVEAEGLGLGDYEEYEKLLSTPPKSKPKVKRVVPPELKNIEDGVKIFQDWLDEYHEGWATGYTDGIILYGRNGGGYGTFGPRTEKKWKEDGVADEFLKYMINGPKEAQTFDEIINNN
jgi:hypothetical protein